MRRSGKNQGLTTVRCVERQRGNHGERERNGSHLRGTIKGKREMVMGGKDGGD